MDSSGLVGIGSVLGKTTPGASIPSGSDGLMPAIITWTGDWESYDTLAGCESSRKQYLQNPPQA